MSSGKLTYQSTGVSIEANDALVQRIQQSMKQTHDQRVINHPNGFVGLFRLLQDSQHYHDPILVSCSDGVGTKVLLALQIGRLDTIGIDLVAMSVNDLITSGATPLFFLDYIAVHQNDPEKTSALVESIAGGCQQAGCALLGGETAEMPDVYRKGEFDLAGFAVGIVEHEELITGQAVKPGDVIIGLSSSGIHSNGYSLVRKLFCDYSNDQMSSPLEGLDNSLGEELLKPTCIYVKEVLSLLAKRPTVVKGMAHITGGGLEGNVPRILSKGCQANLDKGSWQVPAIFQIMQSMGVAEEEMYRVFNMGIGLVLVVRPDDQQPVIKHFQDCGVTAWKIGDIIAD